jgi:hypothetical protein
MREMLKSNGECGSVTEMKKNVQRDEQLKRVHKQSFLLNTLEMRAINSYCKKYGISNRSKFIRETVVTAILRKFEDDHPTLFDT